MDVDSTEYGLEDLQAAVRHLEDLDVFVGQRSRMHPGPGWAMTLEIIRRELEVLRRELQDKKPSPSGRGLGEGLAESTTVSRVT